MLIAIDGPAGVGKSTVAQLLAKKLNLVHIDSGALYRSLAFLSIQKQLSPENTLNYLSNNKNTFQFTYLKNKQQILLNQISIDKEIRQNQVTKKTAEFANNPNCRSWVNSLLKELAKTKSLIIDGRDIGSIVFPEANCKFYLDASVEVRAQRRALENKTSLSYQEIQNLQKEIEKRDLQDKNRKIAPLLKAKDATYLDSSTMSKDEVVEYFYNIIKN